MINTIVSILGLGHQYISGIQQDKKIDQFINHLSNINTNIEKLSDRIYYAPTIRPIISASEDIRDRREILRNIEPLAKALDREMLLTGVTSTPEKTQKGIKANPWEMLDNIRPHNLAEQHSNPDMIPIMFENNNTNYIGWQLKGAIPILFDWEFNEDNELWSSASKGSSQVNPNLNSNIHNLIRPQPNRWNTNHNKLKIYSKPNILTIENSAILKGGVGVKKVPIDQSKNFSIDVTVNLTNSFLPENYTYGIYVGSLSLRYGAEIAFQVNEKGKFIHLRRNYDFWRTSNFYKGEGYILNFLGAKDINLKIKKIWTTIEFYIDNQLVFEGPFKEFSYSKDRGIGFFITKGCKLEITKFIVSN